MIKKVHVIIPAYNEEKSIGKVIKDIPKHLVTEIIVVNNNSTDGTDSEAAKHKVTVLNETFQGYGAACLKGIHYLENSKQVPKIIVFMDADYSDYPQEMGMIIQPILDNKADMVIGSRALGNKENGSMTTPQIFGNWLATRLLKIFYKVHFTDLGPFRAIRWESLLELDMKDKTYGWTVEMQLKAAKKKLLTTEIPVNYRVRIGTSKVSGTIKGTIMAG